LAAAAAFNERKRQIREVNDAKQNPFELRFTKHKHEVLGQKVKGVTGNRVAARDNDIQTRKKTLLVQMKSKSKSNLFMDKRFGEFNENLSAEEKMMQRFQYERLKFHEKNSAFNLPDNDDEELTHRGRILGEEDYDAPLFNDDYDEAEDAKEEANAMDKLNFGGFEKKEFDGEDDDGRVRTRKEIMEEVIAKSKHYKRERQADKQEMDNLTEKLDAEFGDISAILFESSAKAEERLRKIPRPKIDNFDRTMRELKTELTGRATDRTKSPQEKAEEEYMRLSRLEADRLDRMGQSSGQTSGKGVEFLPERDSVAPKRARMVLKHTKEGKAIISREGDFSKPKDEFDWDESKTREADEAEDADSDEDVSMDEDEDDDDDEDEDEDDEDELEEDEDEDGDEDDMEDDDGDDNDVEDVVMTSESSVDAKSKIVPSDGPAELAYTYTMPKDEASIVELLKGHTIPNKMTIVSRIVVCHNINLKAENRGLMKRFFGYLLDYMVTVADSNQTEAFDIVNALAPLLYQISQQMPDHAARCLLDHVERIAGELRIEGGIMSFSDACLLQLIPLLFPASDLRHKVVTPAFIVLGQILSGDMQDQNDIVAGMVACSIALEYSTPAKKFCPEAIGFLTALVAAWCGERDDGSYHFQFKGGMTVLHDSAIDSTAYTPLTPQPMQFSWISECTDPIDSQWRLNVLVCALDLLTRFAKLYTHLPAFGTIFARTAALVKKLQSDKLCPNEEVAAKLGDLLIECKDRPNSYEPLTLQEHKPVPIIMLEPEVQEGNFYGRKTDPDKEHRELRKLKHLHKQEMRGAIRELRKDAKFVANVKQREKSDFDADRDVVVKRYENMLAQDHGDFNTADRKAQRAKNKRRN